MSNLYFYHAPMNSGKSALLLLKAHQFEERHIPFLILKSSIDTRDKGVIHSRPLGDRTCITITPKDNILNVIKNNKISAEWILVDEAQFLTAKQVDELSDAVDFWNINVICYGLRTDFQTHLFEGSKRLFEIADIIEEVESQCGCSGKNIFNVRYDKNGKIITEGKQIEVGAEDLYKTMCRKCYKEEISIN